MKTYEFLSKTWLTSFDEIKHEETGEDLKVQFGGDHGDVSQELPLEEFKLFLQCHQKSMKE